MNPLPRVDAAVYPDAMDAFPAPCYDPNPPADGTAKDGLCSGWYGPNNLEIVDTVRVPASLTPGKYVVQVRALLCCIAFVSDSHACWRPFRS